VPTNAADAPVSVIPAAKAAIHAGDQLGALALLDGIRTRPSVGGREFPPVVAEALVATARGTGDSDRELLARRVREVDAALKQILDWLGALPFAPEDLAQIADTLSVRRKAVEAATDRTEQDRVNRWFDGCPFFWRRLA
jgi:hypothetical protein